MRRAPALLTLLLVGQGAGGTARPVAGGTLAGETGANRHQTGSVIGQGEPGTLIIQRIVGEPVVSSKNRRLFLVINTERTDLLTDRLGRWPAANGLDGLLYIPHCASMTGGITASRWTRRAAVALATKHGARQLAGILATLSRHTDHPEYSPNPRRRVGTLERRTAALGLHDRQRQRGRWRQGRPLPRIQPITLATRRIQRGSLLSVRSASRMVR